MNQIQPLIDLLAGRFGCIPTVIAYLTAVRAALKFFSAGIQQRFTAHLVATAQSPDASDDLDIEGLLGSRWYRAIEFTLDVLFGFRLPTLADFLRMKNQPNEIKL